MTFVNCFEALVCLTGGGTGEAGLPPGGQHSEGVEEGVVASERGGM